MSFKILRNNITKVRADAIVNTANPMPAVELNCKSVAIPLLATGNYRFPKDLALQIAVDEISRFLLEHEVDVLLVVYDKESYKISERIFDDVEDFLFDNLDGYEGEDDRDLDFFPSTAITGAPPEKLFAERELNNSLKAAGAVNLEPVHYAEKEIAPIDVDAFRMSFLMTTAKNVLLLCKSFRQKGDPERPVFLYHRVIRRHYVRSNFRRYNRAAL